MAAERPQPSTSVKTISGGYSGRQPSGRRPAFIRQSSSRDLAGLADAPTRSPSPASQSDNDEANATFYTQDTGVILVSDSEEKPFQAGQQGLAVPESDQKLLPDKPYSSPVETLLTELRARWSKISKDSDEIFKKTIDPSIPQPQADWYRACLSDLRAYERSLRDDIFRLSPLPPDSILHSQQAAMTAHGETLRTMWARR
ncbi:MAG: hypothetical protein JOS17DRAFT_735913 [Linnemannia elongata]|nr:MAG: hypothetical protein JOS17DRAFT_735913 [Linnemannia elongata]